MLTTTYNFLVERCGAAEAQRLVGTLPIEVQRAIETAKPADWYPCDHISQLAAFVASAVGKSEEVRARDALVECGKCGAREATSTFLRLFMRILTPAIFARKLPEVWARDNSGGVVTVTSSDTSLVCTIAQVKDYDHVGPIAVGWAWFTLEAMGLKVERYELKGWTLKEPGPDTNTFKLFWKK
jgi:hypothetical protein